MGGELSILISSVYSISRFFKEQQLKSPVAFQGFFLKVYIEPVKGVLRPGCLGASEATFQQCRAVTRHFGREVGPAGSLAVWPSSLRGPALLLAEHNTHRDSHTSHPFLSCEETDSFNLIAYRSKKLRTASLPVLHLKKLFLFLQRES